MRKREILVQLFPKEYKLISLSLSYFSIFFTTFLSLSFTIFSFITITAKLCIVSHFFYLLKVHFTVIITTVSISFFYLVSTLICIPPLVSLSFIHFHTSVQWVMRSSAHITAPPSISSVRFEPLHPSLSRGVVSCAHTHTQEGHTPGGGACRAKAACTLLTHTRTHTHIHTYIHTLRGVCMCLSVPHIRPNAFSTKFTRGGDWVTVS